VGASGVFEYVFHGTCFGNMYGLSKATQIQSAARMKPASVAYLRLTPSGKAGSAGNAGIENATISAACGLIEDRGRRLGVNKRC
jgi:hypothetical protein